MGSLWRDGILWLMKDTVQPGSLISTAISDYSDVNVSVHETTKPSAPVTCYMLQSMISNLLVLLSKKKWY